MGKMKNKGKGFNIHSLKMNLLILPILYVVITLSILGALITHQVSKGLENEMRQGGELLLNDVTERIIVNEKTLNIINESVEDVLLQALDRVGNMEVSIDSNEIMQDLALVTKIDELNLYNTDGVIMFSNKPDYVGFKAAADNPLTAFIKSDERIQIDDLRQDALSDKWVKYGAIKDDDGNIFQVGLEATYVKDMLEQFDKQVILESIYDPESIVYASYINNDLIIEANTEAEYIGSDIHQGNNELKSLEAGKNYSNVIKNEDGTSIYDMKRKISIDGKDAGIINIGLSMDDINANRKKIVAYLLVAVLLIIIFLSIVLYRSSSRVIKVVDSMSMDMKAMARGDFTNEIPEEFLSQKDEFGEIANSANRMKAGVREMLASVVDRIDSFYKHSEELSRTMEEYERASDELANVIQEIAEGATSQAQDAEQGFMSVKDLDRTIIENAENMQKLGEATQGVNILKNEGLDLVNDLIEKAKESQKASHEVSEIISNTNESAERIANASEMIKSIADQTNLLALNAAIEAARAGEAGKGFAVVAEEIRKLAEQSNSFTEEIEGIVRDLISKTQMTVATMSEMGETISSQVASVDRTSDKFDGIAASLNEMQTILDLVQLSGQMIENEKNKISNIIGNLASISEENAAGSQEASASVEEQNAGITEVASSSKELADISLELKDLIDRFKI